MLKYLPIIITVATLAAAAPLIFKLFFRNPKEFRECFRYGLKPNFLSWLDKDLQNDYGKSLKLNLFCFVMIAFGVLILAIADGIING